MRSITYPCGCVNEVQPNTSLRAVHKCEAHVSQAKEPTTLDAAYYASLGVLKVDTPHIAELEAALGVIPHVTNLKYVLEVGAGCSPYAKTFMRRGWKYYACEPSAYACNILRTSFARVYEDTIEDADFGDAKFDIILAAHVLEHVVHPSEVLRKLAKHLARNGKLLIIVPTMDDPVNPEHLWCFNPDAMRMLLTNADMRATQIEVKRVIERERFMYVEAVHDR